MSKFPAVAYATARVWEIIVRRLIFGIGLIISIGALFLAFKDVEWEALLDALRRANYAWMIPAAIAMLLAIAARAERWRWLLGGRGDVSYMRSFRAVSIGYLMSNVLPFRLGELVRPIVISRGGKVSGVKAFSTVAVEHVLDILVILVMLALVLPDLPLPPVVAQGARLSAIVFGVVALAMVLMVLWQRRAERILSWILHRIPLLNAETWLGRFNAVMDGIAVIRNPRLFLGAALWSAFAWLISAVSFYFAMLAFIPDASISAALFVTITSTLVLLVPSTPGYVGVIEFAIRDSLIIFAIPIELGLAYAIGFHFMELAVMNVSGLVSLVREGMSWSTAVSEARRAEVVTHDRSAAITMEDSG